MLHSKVCDRLRCKERREAAVAIRITISNSAISFASETQEFSLGKSLNWPCSPCTPCEFHVFYTHLCGAPWDASAHCFCSPNIHKGMLCHCFKGYTGFPLFLTRDDKKANTNPTKQPQTRLCSTLSLPVCGGVLQHQPRSADRSWHCQDFLISGSRAFMVRGS